jgi:hypothetical protein
MLNLSNTIGVIVYNATCSVCYSDQSSLLETLNTSFYLPVPSTPHYTVLRQLPDQKDPQMFLIPSGQFSLRAFPNSLVRRKTRRFSFSLLDISL